MDGIKTKSTGYSPRPRKARFVRRFSFFPRSTCEPVRRIIVILSIDRSIDKSINQSINQLKTRVDHFMHGLSAGIKKIRIAFEERWLGSYLLGSVVIFPFYMCQAKYRIYSNKCQTSN